jgi:hypothetical protein
LANENQLDRLKQGGSAMDVTEWLRKLGLEQYEPALRANEIDAEVLPNLTAEDLKDLGVTLVGHRRRLLNAIVSLRAEGGALGYQVPEKILDYVLKKCDSTKKDLEKSWLYQITSVAASLAMIMGLGKVVSQKIFEILDTKRCYILFYR